MALWKKILIAMVTIIFSISLLIGVSAFELTGTVVRNFESEIVQLTASSTVDQMIGLFSDARSIMARMVEETSAHEIAEYSNLSIEDKEYYSNLLNHNLRDFLDLSQLTGADTFHFVNMYLKNGVEAVTAGNGVLPYNNFDEVCDYLDQDRIVSTDEYRNVVWFDVVQLNNTRGIQANCFLCVRFLYDRVTMQRIGAIVAGVDTNKLWSMYKSIFPDAMIINTWGDVVVGGKSLDRTVSAPDELMQSLYHVQRQNDRITFEWKGEIQQALGWKVANGYAYFVVLLKETELFESRTIQQFFSKISVVIATAIIIASIAAIFFSKSVTNGLRKLEKTAKRVAAGERGIRFNLKKHDEVSFVGLQFNNMLDQLEEYYSDLQLSEKEKTDLELSLLYAKINPHLLYNSLDIVVWAIKNDNRQKAEHIVYAMSDFFKRSLAKGQEYTTLNDSIDLIHSYLELQRLAGDRDYRLQADIPPGLETYKLLHLLLQPIVENSVVHGFSGFRDDGTICISAQVVGNQLELHVYDDGLGIPPDKLDAVNRYLNEDLYKEEMRHYGLRNVVRRIKTYYGKEYGIQISSEVGEFTDVVIRIPYTEE